MLKRAIIGVGNILLSDEGIGIHAVRKLREMKIPREVALYDGGTEGFGLMDIVVELDRLVFIDCVRAGEKPGTIYCFDANELDNSFAGYKTSVHQVGILDVLNLAELVGKRPHTTIVGVEPASLTLGMELSPVVQDKLPQITSLSLDMVLKE